MKFLELILRNLARQPRRTVLTSLTVAVATMMFAMLIAVPTSINRIVAAAAGRGQRLYVINRTGPYNLPARYCLGIAQIDHVTACAAEIDLWFYYRSDTDWIGVDAADPEILNTKPSGFLLPQAAAQFRRERRAAIVGVETLQRYDLHIGQQIELRGQFGETRVKLPFLIAGVFFEKSLPNAFMIRRDYFDDTMQSLGQGVFQNASDRLIVRVDRADNVGQVARLIDRNYRNSESETRTQAESDFVASELSNIENIRVIIFTLLGVVLVTVMLVAGNSMAMTVRERIPEIALLRTLGFQRVRIAALLFAEAFILGFAGGVLGSASAMLLFAGGKDLDSITNGIGLISVSWWVATAALASTIATSVLSGTLPIAGALRIAPALGLRKVV
jgi:putative ABC transport system permease protein